MLVYLCVCCFLFSSKTNKQMFAGVSVSTVYVVETHLRRRLHSAPPAQLWGTALWPEEQTPQVIHQSTSSYTQTKESTFHNLLSPPAPSPASVSEPAGGGYPWHWLRNSVWVQTSTGLWTHWAPAVGEIKHHLTVVTHVIKLLLPSREQHLKAGLHDLNPL